MSDASAPRLHLFGPVRIDGEGTFPIADREAAAGRRLLTLLALEANPLTLDHLAARLLGDDPHGKRAELAAEIRRARSAVGRSLGEHAELLTTVRAGETKLAPELIAGADLVQLYAAHDEGRHDDVLRLLPSPEIEVLGGVSEFSYVFGDGGDGALRMERLVAEHRARVASIRAEHENVVSTQSTRARQRQRPRPRPRRSAVAIAIAAVTVAGLGALLATDGGGHSRGGDAAGGHHPPAALISHGTSRRRTVLVIDNRVTNGNTMRQDRTPVTLSSRPDVYCGRGQCMIANTERWSGESYDAAVCQTMGIRTTNGNDNDRSDDDNPDLVSSRRYYGVRLRDGTFGFVSEVWIRADQRGGLGLRQC